MGVLNNKGGTGKTTTVVNLGAGLARRDVKVLLVDLDAQGSLATYLGTAYKNTLADMLMGEVEPSECVYGARLNLDILPSNRRILRAEGELWRMGRRRTARQIFPDLMRNFNSDYDMILVDFSPSATLLNESGLLYVEEIIIPVTMNHLALVGMAQVISILKAVKMIPDHDISLSTILPTMYHSHYQKDQEILEKLKKIFTSKVSQPIRTNVRLAEAPAKHKTIFEYAPRSYGAADYAKLVDRIFNS
jgi:chromosome partitioning protein